MSRWYGSQRRRRGRFPRVSGDEPLTIGEVITLEEFSPRERG